MPVGFVNDHAGHGIQGVLRVWFLGYRVHHLVTVAMVRCQYHRKTGLFRRIQHTAYLFIQSFNRLDDSLPEETELDLSADEAGELDLDLSDEESEIGEETDLAEGELDLDSGLDLDLPDEATLDEETELVEEELLDLLLS